MILVFVEILVILVYKVSVAMTVRLATLVLLVLQVNKALKESKV